MKRWLSIALALAILSLSVQGLIGSVVAQDATPATDTVMVEASPMTVEECEGVTEYARILIQLGAGLAAASYGLPSTAVAQWSDEIYTQFIDALTWAIEKLTGATPTEATQKLNEYAITALTAIQAAVEFLRTSGVGASLPFGDQLGQVDEMIGTLITMLEGACPGLTAELATPVASPVAS